MNRPPITAGPFVIDAAGPQARHQSAEDRSWTKHQHRRMPIRLYRSDKSSVERRGLVACRRPDRCMNPARRKSVAAITQVQCASRSWPTSVRVDQPG